ncbi:unnamed protein product [Lupinus luteus]|uniref:Uncharacterized protein n=1 Tax=Lupinus luteus TaxID=3873 RepID=A0AAV1XA65_LUPLU
MPRKGIRTIMEQDRQCPERNPRYHVTRSADRKRLGLGPSRVFSDGRSGGDCTSLTLRVDVRSRPTRSIPVRRWLKMANNSTHIRGYHFTMSPAGQWSSDGHRYTYTGPCGLSVHMVCTGSSMMIPHPNAFIDASFTLPPRGPTTTDDGIGFPPVRSDGDGPSQSVELSGAVAWEEAPARSLPFRGCHLL